MELEKFLLIQEDEEVLLEGIKFFKVSNRLKKLNDKIIQRVDMVKSSYQKELLIQNAGKIERLSNRFKNIEDKYAGRQESELSKPEIKQRYKEALREYKEILNYMKKEETRAVLKGINMWGFMILTLAIPLKFIAPVSNIIGINLNATDWLSVLKRSGVYLALQLPTRIISGLLGKGIDKAIDSTTDKDSLESNIQNALKNKNI
jgi:cell fate (sporulation/competence/biofilm development) regulator YmcA (YheA/YmcA/DUF963 family)